jgi:hypothetical protein
MGACRIFSGRARCEHRRQRRDGQCPSNPSHMSLSHVMLPWTSTTPTPAESFLDDRQRIRPTLEMSQTFGRETAGIAAVQQTASSRHIDFFRLAISNRPSFR